MQKADNNRFRLHHKVAEVVKGGRVTVEIIKTGQAIRMIEQI